MNGYNRTALVAGIVFTALGVVFLLDDLDVIEVQAAYVFPVVLIVIGLVVLFGGMSRRREEPGPDEG